MAEVLKARDTSQPSRPIVAVKRILPHLTDDRQYVTMFLDESRVLAQLEHDNIIRTLEVGEVGETPFIALEYVFGQDARMLFHRSRRSDQRLPIGVSCYIIAQACAALHHAHEQADAYGNLLGLVHRDVSLQNILVSYDGAVKLTDFGIAMSSENKARTEAGIVKGKFGYMSPEQIRGETMDRRSDVFAAGICLYELLTSERLFSGESDYAAVEKVRAVAVEPPSRFNREIPSALEAIAMKALAKHPRDRYQSAADLRRALLGFMAESHHECSPHELAEYMRGAFSDELSQRPSPESLRDEGRKRNDAPTGLAAFDHLDPVSTVSSASAMQPSPIASDFEERPRRVGAPSVPPVIPRRDSVPAGRRGGDFFGANEPRHVLGTASMASATPAVVQVALEWEEDQPATGTEGLADMRPLPDLAEHESSEDEVTRQLYIGETFSGVPLDAAMLRPAGASAAGLSAARVPYIDREAVAREASANDARAEPWLTQSFPQTSYGTVVGIVIGIVAAIALALYLTRGARPAEVYLATAPLDAEVRVDGKPQKAQRSPFVISELAAGSPHQIDVSKNGYRAWSTRLVLSSGQVLRLPPVTLEPEAAPDPIPPSTPPAQEPVEAAPAVAVAAPQVGSEPKTTTPAVAKPSPSAASAPRQPPWPPRERGPRIENPQPTLAKTRPSAGARRPPPVAAPAPVASAGSGVLRINSRPWSQLTIDGRPAGNTPQMNLQLPAGKHTLRLTNPQFGLSKTLKIQITSGQTLTKVVTLP
jgi:serine/threonine protein kinase